MSVADEILMLHKRGMPVSQICLHVKASPSYVRHTIMGAWEQGLPLGESETYKAPAEKKAPSGRSNALPDDTVRAIRGRYGWASADVAAKEFGVSVSCVRRIWQGETYKEVR